MSKIVEHINGLGRVPDSAVPLKAAPLAEAAPKKPRPGALHTAHLLHELCKDTLGIIAALEEKLGPVLTPANAAPAPEIQDDAGESPLVNSLNAAGTLAMHSRRRLESLVERLRV